MDNLRRLSFLDGGDPQVSFLLDQFREGIIIVGRDGTIRYLNRAFSEFLGISKRDVIGKQVKTIIPSSEIQEVIETGKPHIGRKHVFVDKREVLSNRLPIKRNGKVVAVLGQVILKSRSELDQVMVAFGLLKEKVREYESKIDKYTYEAKYSFDDILAADSCILNAKKQAQKVARSLSAVLIEGESGTGKEVFAHAMHRDSPRRNGPFVRLNCAAIPTELFEAELFGHVSGAFTGALESGRPGKFEMANGGTIFLDEIGDMPIQMQAKLLRVLEDGEICRLGDNKIRRISFACIAATNRDLEAMVKDKTFRMDLYYRLNTVHLRLPPLRDMNNTLVLLCERTIKNRSLELGMASPRISDEVSRLFKTYDWPGNARELKNIIEGALSLCEGDTIQVSDLPSRFLRRSLYKKFGRSGRVGLSEIVSEIEKEIITKCLQQNNYNMSSAAKALGIHRTWLYKKMIHLKIERQETA